MTALTERQRKFAEYYVQCGNATQSAVKAGYSEKFANTNAAKLLQNTTVAAYIKQLSEAAQTARIMTARDRQELLSDIARGEDNAAADRIRAVDTLNKMTGEYTTKVEASVQKNPFAELTTEELRKVIGSG
ncbi:terminase small subunit [Ruminococcus callidus]|uniref:terminase small subunit n=1 Tax=Ruminococcus callidus TaxID=40519 RepID=UPI003FD759DB